MLAAIPSPAWPAPRVWASRCANHRSTPRAATVTTSAAIGSGSGEPIVAASTSTRVSARSAR